MLHGLPTWAIPLDRVEVTRSRSSGGHKGRALHVHTAPLGPEEVLAIDGIPVTDVARTVVDLARSVGFEQAVVVADAALHLGLTDADRLAAVLARSARRPGNRDARRVVGFADGASDSVGESRSRVSIHRARLPAPVLQWEVAGHYADFAWPRHRTVGEFDGRAKYRRLLRPGEEPGDAVFREKVREDAIRDHGLRVVRWVCADLDDFTSTARRLARAFA